MTLVDYVINSNKIIDCIDEASEKCAAELSRITTMGIRTEGTELIHANYKSGYMRENIKKMLDIIMVYQSERPVKARDAFDDFLKEIGYTMGADDGK